MSPCRCGWWGRSHWTCEKRDPEDLRSAGTNGRERLIVPRIGVLNDRSPFFLFTTRRHGKFLVSPNVYVLPLRLSGTRLSDLCRPPSSLDGVGRIPDFLLTVLDIDYSTPRSASHRKNGDRKRKKENFSIDINYILY